MVLLFFFFKQKTAYEMRISDWSSDVCSSDLPVGRRRQDHRGVAPSEERRRQAVQDAVRPDRGRRASAQVSSRPAGVRFHGGLPAVVDRARHDAQRQPGYPPEGRVAGRVPASADRGSEEHTSELQSLMRISYAVFCLTKKTLKHDTLRIMTT